MTAEPRSLFQDVPREVLEALVAFEDAAKTVLNRVPNHWHEYRTPLELPEEIRQARSLARKAKEYLDA